mmetsp:Transcript_32108/g.44513  ORF Transcript_32108/g.44513 Transcript_32108/m.44513 type:complete len:211 (-) Transcript_32108:1912-2544(-)
MGPILSGKSVQNHLVELRLFLSKITFFNSFQRICEICTRYEVFLSFKETVNLLHRAPKDETIFLSNLFPDLNVGSIHGSNEKSSIHGKLHVRGARGLGTGSRNLLRELSSRNYYFSSGHVIVGNEDNLQEVTNIRIVVDLGSNSVDKFDDLFGHGITCSSLASNHHDLWCQLGFLIWGHGLDLGVRVNTPNNIQQLALVFVNSFDLDIKE